MTTFWLKTEHSKDLVFKSLPLVKCKMFDKKFCNINWMILIPLIEDVKIIPKIVTRNFFHNKFISNYYEP